MYRKNRNSLFLCGAERLLSDQSESTMKIPSVGSAPRPDRVTLVDCAHFLDASMWPKPQNRWTLNLLKEDRLL
jgi:hypothetical protein